MPVYVCNNMQMIKLLNNKHYVVSFVMGFCFEKGGSVISFSNCKYLHTLYIHILYLQKLNEDTKLRTSLRQLY